MKKMPNLSKIFVVLLVIILLSQNPSLALAQELFVGLPPHFFKFKNINSPATVLINQNFTVTGILAANLPVRSADEVYVSISTSNNVWVYGDRIVEMGTFGDEDERKFTYVMKALNKGPIDISLTVTAIRDTTTLIEETTQTRIQAVSALTSFPEQSSEPKISFANVNFPSVLRANQEFDITMNLINTGALPAKDVFIVVNLPDNIFLSNNTSVTFNELLSNEPKPIKFTFTAKKQGSFDAKFQAFSSNAQPTLVPITFTVLDPTINIALSGLKTNPLQLYPGESENEIKVGLTNFGESQLQTVIAKLELPDGFSPSWSASDQSILGFLPSAKTFPTIAQQFTSFYIDIDERTNPGNYDLKLNLQVADGEEFKINIPVLILPKAKFEIKSLSYTSSGTVGTEYLDSVSPGKTTVLRVVLQNIGNDPAESVAIQLQTPNDFEGVRSDVHPSFGNVDSLGTIYPGQNFHSTFFLNVDDTVLPNVYPGTIKINWQQSKLSGEFSQQIPITINVSSTPMLEQIPYLQIFLAGISIIFVILYLKSRSEKNIQVSSNTDPNKSTPV